MKQALREALNSYHDLDALEHSPLGNLQVVRASLPEGMLPAPITLHCKGLAVRRLLDEAMAELDQDKPKAAALLRERFRREQSAQELSEVLGTGPSTIYDHQNRAIAALAAIVTKMEVQVATAHVARIHSLLTNLPIGTYRKFLGHEPTLAHIREALLTPHATSHQPLAIIGLGGLGKTSVLREALYRWLTEHQPETEHILWATVVQGTERVRQSAEHRERYSLEHVLNQFADQLDEPLATLASNDKRLRALANRLGQESSIVVIDNVETADDVALAVAMIETLAPVAQIFITSRYRIDHPGVQPLELRELTEAEATHLLQSEAQRLGKETLDEIVVREVWQHVGGNPLALKLVVAQTAVLPINRVLAGLREYSASIQRLLSHVYETSWQLLSATAQELLLGLVALPLIGATWQGLRLVISADDNNLDDASLELVLDELNALSLLQVSPTLDPTYSLHRLTYRFVERKLGFVSESDDD